MNDGEPMNELLACSRLFVEIQSKLYAEVNNLWQQLVKMNLTRMEVLR